MLKYIKTLADAHQQCRVYYFGHLKRERERGCTQARWLSFSPFQILNGLQFQNLVLKNHLEDYWLS